MKQLSYDFVASSPENNTINENWLLLKTNLCKIMEHVVPSKMSNQKRHLPWIDHPIKRQMRKRDKRASRARRTHSAHHWAEYRQQRNKVFKISQVSTYQVYKQHHWREPCRKSKDILVICQTNEDRKSWCPNPPK